MVSGEEGGIGEGDVGGSGTDGLINPGGSGHPGRRRNSTEEMVALGVDAVEEEEVAILDGAAVEGGEDVKLLAEAGRRWTKLERFGWPMRWMLTT